MQCILADSETEGIAEVQALIYVIWERRNRCVFEGVEVQIDAIIRRGGTLRVLLLPAAQTQRGQHPSRGKRPRHRWIKINIDAAVGADRLVGFGMVARDSNGDIMAAASWYPVVVLSLV